MPVQFRNPFPLLIKFKTLINNPNSSLQSHRFFPHLRFFSSSTSSPAPVNCISSITETVVTTPMTSLMRKLYDLARDRVGVKRDSEFSIATQCRIKYNYVYKLILQTPFVIALTAGNLKSSVFRHYIAQDYYFLLAYKTAYAAFLFSLIFFLYFTFWISYISYVVFRLLWLWIYIMLRLIESFDLSEMLVNTVVFLIYMFRFFVPYDYFYELTVILFILLSFHYLNWLPSLGFLWKSGSLVYRNLIH